MTSSYLNRAAKKARLPIKVLPTEEDEQVALALWLGTRKGLLWTHPPNGGVRDWRTARRLSALGVSPGVPDILIFTPPPARPECVGCAIELKRQKGTSASREQKAWLRELALVHWATHVCHGAQHAIDVLVGLGY